MTQKQPSTAAEIRERLQGIGSEADELMNCFDRRKLAPAAVEQMKERFRLLKIELESAYRSMATIQGEAALSRTASAFYWPAIQDAWANSGITAVRWDTRPNDKWYDALYQVRFYMNYWRDNLIRATEEEQSER